MVVSLDFQRMSYLDFENESAFVHGMARESGQNSASDGLLWLVAAAVTLYIIAMNKNN